MRAAALLLSLVSSGCMIHSVWSGRLERQCGQLKSGMTVEDAYRIVTVTTPYCEYNVRPGLPQGRVVAELLAASADHPSSLSWESPGRS